MSSNFIQTLAKRLSFTKSSTSELVVNKDELEERIRNLSSQWAEQETNAALKEQLHTSVTALLGNNTFYKGRSIFVFRKEDKIQALFDYDLTPNILKRTNRCFVYALNGLSLKPTGEIVAKPFLIKILLKDENGTVPPKFITETRRGISTLTKVLQRFGSSPLAKPFTQIPLKDGEICFVTSYHKGGDLSDFVAKIYAVFDENPHECRKILIQTSKNIAADVAWCQEKGIYTGDLRENNTVLKLTKTNEQWITKEIDFDSGYIEPEIHSIETWQGEFPKEEEMIFSRFLSPFQTIKKTGESAKAFKEILWKKGSTYAEAREAHSLFRKNLFMLNSWQMGLKLLKTLTMLPPEKFLKLFCYTSYSKDNMSDTDVSSVCFDEIEEKLKEIGYLQDLGTAKFDQLVILFKDIFNLKDDERPLPSAIKERWDSIFNA